MSKATNTGSQVRPSRGCVKSRWCPRSSTFLQEGNSKQARKTETGSRLRRASSWSSELESARVIKDAADIFLVSSKREKILRSRRSAVVNVPRYMGERGST